MAFAISPDTPVSISSKIKVGSWDFSATMDLITSMMRDSSPPEATLFNGAKSMPLLAENNRAASSTPLAVGAARGLSTMENCTCSIPKSRERLASASARGLHACCR